FTDRRVTPEELPDDGCTPRDTALSDAILRLPHKQKEAVLLYYYHGMTLEETAAALGVRPASASLRLKRARAQLKNLLGGDDQDEN
ncbi:MAG: sigma-70 family RNA polymerase sigma factor, partial [Eubacteriales bacterium]|nr:sigma-70 family RNA polymerase sigma factor [Eubacteriales bacterium]